MKYGVGADRGKQNWGGHRGGTASQAWEQSILEEMAWELVVCGPYQMRESANRCRGVK